MSKPTWVFVVGPPRSGSSTQYDITRTIAEDKNKGIGIGYHTEDQLKEYDRSGHDMIVCKVFAYLPEYYYDVPNGMRKRESYGRKIFDEGRLKAVMTIRNPFDIVTSMKRRDIDRGQDFDFKKVLSELPRHFGDALAWASLSPDIIYISRFEDYTAHLPRETANIAHHIGIPIEMDEAHRIGNLFKIDEIKKRKGRQHNPPPENEKRHLPSVPDIKFGTSGQWQTWLSRPEQNAVREVAAEYIERFGY